MDLWQAASALMRCYALWSYNVVLPVKIRKHVLLRFNIGMDFVFNYTYRSQVHDHNSKYPLYV